MNKIVIIGHPNSGKTTLFNAITVSDNDVGNWSGVTVGQAQGFGNAILTNKTIVDLPGIYSIIGGEEDRPIDEKFTQEYINTQIDDNHVILNLVDITQLNSQLYLTTQLLERNYKVIVVLTMIDVVGKEHSKAVAESLSKELGIPVVTLGPRQSKKDLAVLEGVVNRSELLIENKVIKKWSSLFGNHHEWIGDKKVPWWYVLNSLEGDIFYEQAIQSKTDLDPLTIKQKFKNQYNEEPDIFIAKHRKSIINQISANLGKNHAKYLDDKIDKIIIGKYTGIPVFLLVMSFLFGVSIMVGGYFQPYFEKAADMLLINPLTYLAKSWLEENAYLSSVFNNGFSVGLITVVTFIPVLWTLFFTLAFFEASGYMARAAFVVDKLMHKLGLPGQSLVPLIVGFGCNVPAVVGSRVVPTLQERIITIMMIPFMSCGARLAIYALFISIFFKSSGTLLLVALYFLGVAAAVLTSFILQNVLFKNHKSTFSVISLPRYRLPSFSMLWNQSIRRLNSFIFSAGKIIIPVCIVFSLLNSFQLSDGSTFLEYIGKAITPLFHPLGIEQNNWQATVGLLSGVIAKEVVVGTLSTLYLPLVSNGDLSQLNQAMAIHFQDMYSVLAYLIFILLYFPCVSVVGAIAKELNAKWAIFSMFWSTFLAYVLASTFYQCMTFKQHYMYSFVVVIVNLSLFTLIVMIMKHIANKHEKNILSINKRVVPTKVILT